MAKGTPHRMASLQMHLIMRNIRFDYDKIWNDAKLEHESGDEFEGSIQK